jgi:hypothetical protein
MPRTFTHKRPRNLDHLTPEERAKLDERQKLLQGVCALLAVHFPGDDLQQARCACECAVYDALLCRLPAWQKAFGNGGAFHLRSGGLLEAIQNTHSSHDKTRGDGKVSPAREKPPVSCYNLKRPA